MYNNILLIIGLYRIISSLYHAYTEIIPEFPTQMCIHWVHLLTMKDAGLRIRVQRDLREKFLEVCRAQDKPAAQVLREFMRDYVTEHESLTQGTDEDSGRPSLKSPKTGSGRG